VSLKPNRKTARTTGHPNCCRQACMYDCTTVRKHDHACSECPLLQVFTNALVVGWLGRSLQKVQGHRTAQGHRAGVDVDVTPPTGGPVGCPPKPATLCDRSAQASGKMRMCGAADVRMFKRVNCGEILRGLSPDVMGKMRRCGYVITLSSRIS